MDKITLLKDSFTPYVIIALTGDESKTKLAISWGLKCQMPRLYINNWKKDYYEIICNIWDVNKTGYTMIPNNTVDHNLLNYSINIKSKPELETDIITALKTSKSFFYKLENKNITILFNKSNTEERLLQYAIEICIENNITYKVLTDDGKIFLQDLCEKIFFDRKKDFDKKLKDILKEVKLKDIKSI